MKNLKKLIAVVLTFTLVFSAMAVGFASPFTDVKSDAPYASAVDRLYSLGLTDGMGNGTFGVDQPLTRAQMVTFVIRALGYDKIAQAAAQDTPAFTDLKGHWAVGYINVAKNLGITDGMGDGTFAPDINVTFGQALAFVIRALGYRVSWGYATLAKAQDLGLTDGLTEGFNDVINRGDMAIVLNRALDQTMVSYDTNGNLIYNSDGTLAGPKLISKVGTSNTYLVVATNDVDSTVPAGYVDVEPATSNYGTYTFGGDQYIPVGSVNFNKYLGEVVTVVSDKSGNPLAVSPVTTYIKTFTVSNPPAPTTAGSTYSFSDVSVNVGNIPVVIDGIKTTLSQVYKVIDKGSNVTLINNDGKSGYDYAVVTDATGNYDGTTPLEILVQKNVTSSDKYIDNRISLYDTSNNPLPVLGAVSKATDIKAGDVVYQVKVTADKTILYVVRQTVTGTISEATLDSNNNITAVTINGKSYTVGKSIPGSTGVGVSAGSTGTAVLGKNNTIVQWTGTSTSEPTNYAVVQYANNFTPYNTSVSLVLPNGNTAVYNVVYSDITATPPTIPAAVYDSYGNRVVKYTVNSSNMIDSLATVKTVYNDVYNNSGKTDKTDNIITINNVPYYVTSSTVFYNYDGKTTLTPVKWSDLPDTTPLNLYAYDTTGINQLTYVIFNNAQNLTSTSTTPLDYVTGVSTIANGSTTFTRLNVLENGVAKTYDATSTLSVAPNKVYQLTLDANGKVTSVGTALTPVNDPGTTVTFDYTKNGITPNGGTELPLDNNVVVIDSTQSTPTQVGLGSISDTTKVQLYKNSTTGKVVLIVIVK